MVFSVTREDPFITTPRTVSRLQSIAVCRRPTPIQNQFFEYLDFGIGPQRSGERCNWWMQGYERNNVVTFKELDPVGKTVRVVYTNSDDIGRRVLIQGVDSNDNTIYSADGLNQVDGIYLTLDTPFAQAPFGITSLTGIQKDITLGPVKFYEVDLTTGDTVLILTMEPSEQVASYRRYYIHALPQNCCADPNNPSTNILVNAIAKLQLVDAVQDTDYLLISSLEALIEEAQAIRFSGMDNGEAQQMAQMKHTMAIRFLQGQIVDQEGKSRPAVSFAPFGSARLERVRIGMV
jgi:hypothetical protein